MFQADFFILIILYIVVFLHIRSIRKYILKNTDHNLRFSVQCAIDALIKVGIFYICRHFHLPPIVLYILMYFGGSWTFGILYKKNKLNFYFWTNIYFIFFVFQQLAYLSAVSLVSGRSLHSAYEYGNSAYLILVLCFAVTNLAEWASARKGLYDKIELLNKDAGRFRQIVYFEWYASAYLLFDSIPCMYGLPYGVLSIFLLGSSLLLLLQVILFMVHTLKIIDKAHYETEYYRLEEQRADYVRREMELNKLAYTDSLTGTYTRRFAMEMLNSMERDQREVTVAYIDVNGLKKVNDTLGHQEGDLYLRLIADTLNERLKKNDILARMGGDEFIILCAGQVKEELEQLLKKVNAELSERKIGALIPSFSYGIAQSGPNTPLSKKELLLRSDRQMYAYKTKFKKGGKAE